MANTTHFLISTGAVTAFLLSAFGWGLLTSSIFYRNINIPASFNATLGIAIYIFLGGLLNATHTAYPVALYIIFGVGLLSSLNRLRNKHNIAVSLPGTFRAYLIPAFILLACTGYLVATLMPTLAFNFHDDFHTYFSRPVRMLATGTIGGNPFDLLGLDSLGAQSFLHAFVLLVFPLQYLNAIDAIACFFLCGCMLIGISRFTKGPWLLTYAALGVFIFINPQYVNVSSLYSGSLMVMGLVFSSILLTNFNDKPTMPAFLSAIPFGLFLSALVALKLTFIVFASVFFVLFFFLAYFHSKKSSHIIRTGIHCAIATIASLAPWVLVSSKNYASALSNSFRKGEINPAERDLPLTDGNLTDVFSFQDLYWGDSGLEYGALVAITLLACILSLYLLRKEKPPIKSPGLIPAIAACAAAVVSYLVLGYTIIPYDAVRYSLPVLIAVLSMVILLTGNSLVSHLSGMSSTQGWGKLILTYLITTLPALLVIIVFSNSFIERVQRSYEKNTLISFPIDENYFLYMHDAFSDKAINWSKSIQERTLPEKGILTYVSIPFHFDFMRNTVLNASDVGLANPWLKLTLGASTEEAMEYLSNLGIRYVIWEYQGYGMRSSKDYLENLNGFGSRKRIAYFNLNFHKLLIAMAKDSKVLYRDRMSILIDIGESEK